MKDGLTGVWNRKYLDERLRGEIAYATRHRSPLAVVIADIDHFKKVNDTYGHLAGDEVLKVTAATMRSALRTEDILARYGGEEFVVVARGVDLKSGVLLAERLRMTIERRPVTVDGQMIDRTISAGVATLECCGAELTIERFSGSPTSGFTARRTAGETASSEDDGKSRVEPSPLALARTMYAPAVNAPPPYPPPPGNPPPPAAAKKGPSGCLVALAIVGGIVALIGLAVGVVAYRFATSPDGKKIVSAVASGATLIAKAQNAPGTAELRARGCKPVMVIDAADVEAIAEAFGDGGTPSVSDDERVHVQCVPARGVAAPTCNDVAATYVAAVGRAAGPFAVTVGASGSAPMCTGRYLADGAPAP